MFSHLPTLQFIPMFPSILELLKVVGNLLPHEQIKKDLKILQTGRLSNSSSASVLRYSLNLLQRLEMSDVSKLHKDYQHHVQVHAQNFLSM